MNLKTHTAYPEIQVEEDFSFLALLIDAKGTICFAYKGQGADRDDATQLACAALEPEQDKYLIKAGVQS